MALVALARALEGSGAIDKHLADEIDKSVKEVLEHADEPDETAEKLSELKGRLADEVEKGKTTQEDAQRLSAAIDRFAATLQGGSEGD